MKRKAKADVVQSTLRLPRALHVRITSIALRKNLSMQQAIEAAVWKYCREENTKGGK
jgi:hypothetical protein